MHTVHGLLCFVALSVPLATVAGDVEDVAAVARLWAETIGRADPDAMVQGWVGVVPPPRSRRRFRSGFVTIPGRWRDRRGAWFS